MPLPPLRARVTCVRCSSDVGYVRELCAELEPSGRRFSWPVEVAQRQHEAARVAFHLVTAAGRRVPLFWARDPSGIAYLTAGADADVYSVLGRCPADRALLHAPRITDEALGVLETEHARAAVRT